MKRRGFPSGVCRVTAITAFTWRAVCMIRFAKSHAWNAPTVLRRWEVRVRR